MTMNTRRRILVGTSAVAVGAMFAPRGRAADDLSEEANVPPNVPTG